MTRANASKKTVVTSAILLTGLMTAFGFILARSDAAAYRELDDRAKTRVEVASGFVSSYVDHVLKDERRQAGEWLRGPTPGARSFDKVSRALNLKAAVLLGKNGKLEAIYPHTPSLIGSDLSGKYAHLDEALDGGTAISEVVPSAAEGIPIIAFATSFQDRGQTKVFSGAMDVRSSPIGEQYLESLSPIAGTSVYIVDSSYKIVAGSMAFEADSLAGEDPALAEALGEPSGHYSKQGTDNFFAWVPIEGTSWRLLMTVPTENLYAPVAGAQRAVPWVVFCAFGVLAVAVLWLLWRAGRYATTLMARNEDLQDKNREIGYMAEQLEELSFIDPLTGVRNRRGFETLFEQQAKYAKRFNEPLEVIYIDINDMKSINDIHGHAAGDEALKIVATTLTSTCRTSDVVARLGGDEFVVSWMKSGDSALMAKRIAESLAVNTRSHRFEVTISIGSARFQPDEDQTLGDVLAHADLEMYEQKKRKRDEPTVALP